MPINYHQMYAITYTICVISTMTCRYLVVHFHIKASRIDDNIGVPGRVGDRKPIVRPKELGS